MNRAGQARIADLLSPRRDRHGGPCSREVLRDVFANSPARPGDERYFAFQAQVLGLRVDVRRILSRPPLTCPFRRAA
ncbi:MAG: hypothetical protein AB7T37_13295 [Dehalococcoidia bacterium]